MVCVQEFKKEFKYIFIYDREIFLFIHLQTAQSVIELTKNVYMRKSIFSKENFNGIRDSFTEPHKISGYIMVNG